VSRADGRWRLADGRRYALCASLLAVVGCVTRRVHEPPVVVFGPSAADSARPAPPADADMPRDEAPRTRVEGWRDVRVALATAAQSVPLDASGAWRLFDGHNAVLLRARQGDVWTVERRGTQLRATRAGGGATSWAEGPLTLRPDLIEAFGVFAGHRYRGAIRVVATDSGLVVVNVLPVEEYLRGVVPLEIGVRAPNEQAAVEAQAIAARSYAWVRLAANEQNASRNPSYDMLSGVTDQVYGGADAERPLADQAVAATRGLVIRYDGRVVSAPYHSSCGGETAAPDEVWRSAAEPYLRRVSDRIPGTADRYYCDAAPRFAWTRTLSGDELDAAVRSYLRSYAAVPASGPGSVRAVSVDARTPSGRVGRLSIQTDRGTYALRGNDVRYVLHTPGSEILNSTYFTVEAESRRDGSLTRLTIKGNGYGHGVGMCQWGAIGRARAGHSARAILSAYYPGVTIGTVN
jgi:stage II sporulation protein D